MSTLCGFSIISAKEFYHKCQAGVGRWSIMGKIDQRILKMPSKEKASLLELVPRHQSDSSDIHTTELHS